MNKINYQVILDKELDKIKKEEKPPKLLLHSCCGPCSSYVLEYLSDFFEISVLYYNPNIYPKEEFYFRSKEQEDLINKMKTKNKISFISLGHKDEDFYKKIKGFEKEKEGGKRCKKCFELRLEFTGNHAKEHSFDYFTTTLSISPHKNSQLLNQIGKEISEKVNVKYLYSDFKKKEGFKRSTILSQIYGIYRQDYCGCEYSLRGSNERKEKSKVIDL